MVTPYFRTAAIILMFALMGGFEARAQDASTPGTPASTVTPEQLHQILQELHAQGERIKELEAALAEQRTAEGGTRGAGINRCTAKCGTDGGAGRVRTARAGVPARAQHAASRWRAYAENQRLSGFQS